MRVSDSMRLDSVTRTLGSLQEQQLKASQVASTGVRVQNISDDPVAAAQYVRIQAATDATTTFRSTINIARSDLDMAENVLSSAGDIMARIQELAVNANNGSLTQDSRDAFATEIDGLRTQLITLANQKGTQGYLFGGSQTGTEPFDEDGGFNGDSLPRVANVSVGVSTVVSVSGADAFTAVGGRDVFDDIAALRDALQSGDTNAVASSVSSLDAARRQILAARLDAGVKSARLDTADSAHQTTQGILASQKHDAVDADSAQAYTKLLALQQAIEQAITVAKTSLNTMNVNRFG